ncbi:hypothetical protein GUITHDRAFT_113919 [Guillardia theta CCMP2712]|uniref:Uncharacterized protein n=1 Tax=Guillardia theta (strain CCMP2712) TaxID=905079 RepID=L1IUJ3_GUITC|nr:hypothetical protein GUITHDRAFT_113919 [Guillardia theta CCMP2712]EKX39926.1 hypothetical protein GUITHDRAFT_113919 [Guillardia theta CCMP2712]|eukprot:XP_005826906.1 hypothetical protein GUITHDRAFT_113919 [Guillardia theta CCMP2712]
MPPAPVAAKTFIVPFPVAAKTLILPAPVAAKTLILPAPVAAKTLILPAPVAAKTLILPAPVAVKTPPAAMIHTSSSFSSADSHTSSLSNSEPCLTSARQLEEPHELPHWEEVQLNLVSARDYFASQLYSQLAHVPATICRKFFVRDSNDLAALQQVNSTEYRTNLCKRFSVHALSGIDPNTKKYSKGHCFELDLCVKVRDGPVHLDSIFNRVVDLNDSESIVCLSNEDGLATTSAAECLSDIRLERGECFHFEITESPSCILEKMYQLDRAYALRNRIHKTNVVIKAMGVFVNGNKEIFKRNSVNILARWREDKEVMLIGKSGVPIFLIYTPCRNVFTSLDQVQTSLSHLEGKVEERLGKVEERFGKAQESNNSRFDEVQKTLWGFIAISMAFYVSSISGFKLTGQHGV